MPPVVPPARPPLRARFVTFGCKVNQYDSEVLAAHARTGGFETTDGAADVIVVNTCTVTESGGADARKAIRRLHRENPDARIYVTGCYAASDRETAAALPGVAGVFGNGEKAELARRLDASAPHRPFVEETVASFGRRARAFVKIQDGCRLRCSFCIIPSVRPELASKSADRVVAEVADLAAAGYEEIVLTGVHLGGYGREAGPAGRDALPTLLDRLLAETPVRRIRLSSLEVFEATPEVLARFAGEPRLAPHLHLPVQSGAAAVLARMRRRYRPEAFLEVVRRFREIVPNAAVSTDVIVGFPGETRADFEETVRLVEAARTVKVHVFPFSPRRGTPAAAAPDPVPAAEIRARAAELAAVARRTGRAYAAELAGRTERALVERRRREGRLTGFTGRYVRVVLDGPDELMGRLVPVKLLDPVGDALPAVRIDAVRSDAVRIDREGSEEP